MKVPNIIFILLIVCFANVQSQTVQTFDPPGRNWSYSRAGNPWESYGYSASVSQLNKGKIVFGIINHSTGGTKTSSTQSIPYYFKLYNTSQPVVLYADSVNHVGYYLGYTNPEFTSLFSPDQNDNLFIASSAFLVSTSIDGPAFTKYVDCSINLITETAGQISRLAHWNNTSHPSIVRDKTGRIHMLWEENTFLNDHSYYSSNIFYTTFINNAMVEKKLIGKGFYPDIKLGRDGKIHALWYEADTMSLSLSYKAKHCTIESGVIGSVDSIYDFHETSGINLSHYYVSRFLPPIQWDVSRTGELELVWIEKQSGIISAGRFSKEKGLEIVKSPSYEYYYNYDDANRYLYPFFKDDGEIIIAWIANQKLYSARSRTNDIFNHISELSLPADVFPAYASFVPVIDTSGAPVYFFLKDKNNFMLKNFPDSSSFEKILPDYSISPGMFIDSLNTVWCVSSSDKPTVIRFAINGSMNNTDTTDTKDTTLSQIPDRFSISQNYPNPFNPATKITYSIPEDQNVKLIVYDILGKEAAVLVDEPRTAGTYTVEFDGSSLPSGIYVYTIQAGQFRDSKKLVLLK